MLYIAVFFIFIFGIILGSFVNALEYRIQNKISITGRSFCPTCKHKLAWYDLLPVISYVFLFGKCRYCKKKILPQYPVIEVVSGLSLLAIFYSSGMLNYFINLNQLFEINVFVVIKMLILVIVSTLLILLALHDYKTSYVLSIYVYVAILLVLLNILITPNGLASLASLLPYIYASLGAALFFAVLHFGSRGRWMGAGDIELAALLGLFLGWPGVLVSLYFAFIIGSVFGLTQIYFKKAKMKSEIPFGPYLVAGIYFAALFSEKIVSFYVKIILGY